MGQVGRHVKFHPRVPWKSHSFVEEERVFHTAGVVEQGTEVWKAPGWTVVWGWGLENECNGSPNEAGTFEEAGVCFVGSCRFSRPLDSVGNESHYGK